MSKRRYWTRAEEALLASLYPDTPMLELVEAFGRSDRTIYSKAHALGLSRSKEYLDGPHAGRLKSGDKRGSSTRFKKGQTPWNTGLTGWQPGGRSAETRFKKGDMPHTWNPIGSERITKDGYLERKMTDTGITRNDYVAVHRLVWEAHNGPIPRGHVVVFRDKLPRHTHITIDRLELISRRANMLRNSIERYGPEYRSAALTLSWFKRKLNNLEQDNENAQRSA